MSFYKPSNQQPGRTIDTATAPGAGGANNPYTKIDPLSHLRGLVDGGVAGSMNTNSGIRWDVVGNSRYEDDGLRALRGDVNADELINQEYILKYSEAAAAFFQSLVQRRGGMYAEYRAVLEHFRYNKKTGAQCQIRGAFVDTLNRHPEFMVVIAKAGVPVFGQILIDMSKASASSNLNESEYRRACQMASSMVLTMELLSWLSKSIEGREKAYNLTAEIKQMVADIERFKDTFTIACTTFGLTNPYAGLVFEVSSPTRVDNSMIVEAERALQGLTRFGGDSFMYSPPQQDATPLLEQVFRTAQQASGRYVPEDNNQLDNGFGQVQWEAKEIDFSRITKENKKHYDYRRLFQWLKDDWYFIPESDWKKVKHAFKRHPDQPEQEDTVLNGSFRVVKIDLDNDNGWFSTVIRAEGLDMAAGFTDPKLLLPALEGVTGSTETQIAAVSAEKLLGKGKAASIPAAVCEKLEGIPVITLKDEVNASSSSAILAGISSTNKVLTANIKGTNATSFNTCIWEYFNCDSESDRLLLLDRLPFLFKDVEMEDEKLSFFMRMKKIVNFFDVEVVDGELADYVDHRLTLMVNDWLINSLGYSNNPEHHAYLAVESIFEDYSELDHVFKENDEEAFRCFNMEGSPVNYLTEQMKIFVSNSIHNKENSKDTIIDKVQKGLRLVTERPIHFTVVNRRLPPSDIDQGNDPILIRRSKFPEFFHLVESGFEPSMGKGKEIKVVDKIIQFSQDDSMWLFSYSSLDINMATMRRVTTRRSLLMLALV